MRPDLWNLLLFLGNFPNGIKDEANFKGKDICLLIIMLQKKKKNYLRKRIIRITLYNIRKKKVLILNEKKKSSKLSFIKTNQGTL